MLNWTFASIFVTLSIAQVCLLNKKWSLFSPPLDNHDNDACLSYVKWVGLDALSYIMGKNVGSTFYH